MLYNYKTIDAWRIFRTYFWCFMWTASVLMRIETIILLYNSRISRAVELNIFYCIQHTKAKDLKQFQTTYEFFSLSSLEQFWSLRCCYHYTQARTLNWLKSINTLDMIFPLNTIALHTAIYFNDHSFNWKNQLMSNIILEIF